MIEGEDHIIDYDCLALMLQKASQTERQALALAYGIARADGSFRGEKVLIKREHLSIAYDTILLNEAFHEGREPSAGG